MHKITQYTLYSLFVCTISSLFLTVCQSTQQYTIAEEQKEINNQQSIEWEEPNFYRDLPSFNLYIYGKGSALFLKLIDSRTHAIAAAQQNALQYIEKILQNAMEIYDKQEKPRTHNLAPYVKVLLGKVEKKLQPKWRIEQLSTSRHGKVFVLVSITKERLLNTIKQTILKEDKNPFSHSQITTIMQHIKNTINVFDPREKESSPQEIKNP